MTQNSQPSLKEQLQQRFQELPQAVQNAILSAKVEEHLRGLATSHQLHLDQWEIFENEVMLTLLGFQNIEDLEKNIHEQVHVGPEVAHTLASSANQEIFEPIRQELERQLEHPEAKKKEVSGVEAARQSALASAQPEASSLQPVAAATNTPRAASPVVPATPPTPAPNIKVARPTGDTSYKPGVTSAQRATVYDDPYREPPV